MMELAITKNTTELEQLEGVIQKNIGAFYEVGRALMEIRDKGLYRDVLGYDTFEAYCKHRWDFNRAYAYRLMGSAQVIDAVSPIGIQSPDNERQTRPLARLEPDQQREAWQKAVETAPEGKVTAAHVSMVVREMVALPTTDNKITITKETIEDSDAIFHLKRWWKKATKKDRQIFLSWKELTGEQPKPYVLKHNEPIIKQELVSEDFQLAYDAMIIELKNALATKWKDTSYKGALEMMRTLVVITEQMGKKRGAVR